MSIFKCEVCEIDFDSDFHEMYKIDDLNVCEDCYNDQIQLNKEPTTSARE